MSLTNVKEFFKRSWSIFLARLEVFTGFVIGMVAAIDWSSLANIDLNAGFTNNQLAFFAVSLIIKGIVSEIGRRSGTVVAKNEQLIPANIAEKAGIETKGPAL